VTRAPELPFDPARIELLEHIDAERTISGAAYAMHFSCSAISERLRRIESDLGSMLVERTPGDARLTPAGRALLDHGLAVMEQIETAEAEVRSIAELGGGRLRLATFRSAAPVVADAIAYFRGRWPGVELTLREGEPEDYVGALRENDLDLALAFEYDELDMPPDTGVDRRLLCEEDLLVVFPAGHRLTARSRVRLEDLAEEPWVGWTPKGVRELITRACARAGFEPRMILSTDDFCVAQALVACGLGVTFVPAICRSTARPDVVVRKLAGLPLRRRVYATFRTGGLRAPAVAAMVDVLAQAFAPARDD